MRIDPKTEQECQAMEQEQKKRLLLPVGVYDFEITKALDKTDKNGNPMIDLQLVVYADNGGMRYVRDWLTVYADFKVRHFAYAVGLVTEYEAGNIEAIDCEGRSGKAKIVIKKDEQYGEQNRVADYIVPDATTTATPAAKPAAAPPVPRGNAPLAEDDIPF